LELVTRRSLGVYANGGYDRGMFEKTSPT